MERIYNLLSSFLGESKQGGYIKGVDEYQFDCPSCAEDNGGVPDGNAIPISHEKAEESMDGAACIGCGACVATCKNGSAMLFVAARVSSLALLPQGKVEGAKRAKAMVAKMDELGFGACTNTRACEMECPKHITVSHISRLNREYLCAKFQD